MRRFSSKKETVEQAVVDNPDLSDVFKRFETAIERFDSMAEDIASLKLRVDCKTEENSTDSLDTNIDTGSSTDTADSYSIEDDSGASPDNEPSKWAKQGNEAKIEATDKRLNFWAVCLIGAALIILTVICCRKASSDIPVRNLDIAMPEEIMAGKVTEIPVGIKGTPGICLQAESTGNIECSIRNGILCLRPSTEGCYTFALAITESDVTHLGLYTVTVTGDLGGEKYKKLAEDVENAINTYLPKEYRSYCKAIGRNFKRVSLDKSLTTTDEMYEAVKTLNDEVLGYNDPSDSVDLKMQASWYEFMNGNAQKETEGIIQKLCIDASTSDSISEQRAIFNALAIGFSKAE